MLHKHIPTQNSELYLCDVFFHSIYTAYRLRVSGHYQVSGRHIFDLFALTSSHVNLALVSSAFSIEVYEHLLRKVGPPGYANPLLQFQGREGLVFKGECLLIPKLMRRKMKERIHKSHIGVNGCLRRARECMYWPGMTAELKEFIAQCETCRQYEVKQQREPLMSHEIAECP